MELLILKLSLNSIYERVPKIFLLLLALKPQLKT
jgi:hypothetical protein